jgi:hypothetical protein
MLYVPSSILLYKLPVFFFELNRLFNLGCLQKNIIKKTSKINFSNFLQGLIFSGLQSINLFINFLLEWEFFFEKRKNKFLVFDHLIHLFLCILYANINSTLDQSTFEHFLSLYKAPFDSRVDLFGINLLKLPFINSDRQFIDVISVLYVNIADEINQKNEQVLNNKFVEILNHKKKYQSNSYLYVFKIKIIKEEFRNFFISGKSNTTSNFRHSKINILYWFKTKKRNFLDTVNIILNNFKNDIDYSIDNLVDLFWFQLHKHKKHFINHTINEIFILPVIYNENEVYEKNQKNSVFYHLYVNNISSLLRCSFEFIKKVAQLSIYLNSKLRDTIIDFLYLFINDLGTRLKIKDLFQFRILNKDPYLLIEIIQKIVKINDSKFYYKLKFLKIFSTSNKVFTNKLIETVFFPIKMFEDNLLVKEKSLNEIKIYFKSDFLLISKKNYLVLVALSILLFDISVRIELLTPRKHKRIILNITENKAIRFIFIKIFSLLELEYNQTTSNYVIKQWDILDSFNLGRSLVIKKIYSILYILCLFEKLIIVFYSLTHKKLIIRKNGKQLLFFINNSDSIKKQYYMKFHRKTEIIKSLFLNKIYNTENSVFESLNLCYNNLFKGHKTFFFLSNINSTYSNWYLFYKISFFLGKKINLFRFKYKRKVVSKITNFLFIIK